MSLKTKLLLHVLVDHQQEYYYFFAAFFLFHGLLLCGAESNSVIYNSCWRDRTYSNTTTFASNVNKLLASLTATASLTSGFSTKSIGTGSDAAYGVALCRGDVSQSTCTYCLTTASNDIVTDSSDYCSGYVNHAVIYMTFCQLGYSDRNIIGVEDHISGKCQVGFRFPDGNLLYNTRSALLVNITATALATTASNATTVPWFASAWTKLTTTQTLYAYVQCSRDITAQDCSGCLQYNIAYIIKCCNNTDYCKLVTPSCTVRYDLFNFLDGNSAVEINAATSDSSIQTSSGSSRLSMIIGSTAAAAVIIIILVGILICVIVKKGSTKPGVYDFKTLRIATQNFSRENLLGEGGFGPVYKGTFPNGQEVAVKRLSKKSSQGDVEFRKEVDLMAAFRHKNLLQIKGYCMDKGEKLLVYEYMENNNLGIFLFDKEKRGELVWKMRFNIICGIARGLSYLHVDCVPTVIHRDLKASNILLDKEMQPKISDFGLVKLFGSNQIIELTNEVAGTRGYMAPEAHVGSISEKLDIYSFGVMILEIISGSRNNSLQFKPAYSHIVSYTWDLWCESTPLELLDGSIKDRSQQQSFEVVKCIQVGLLCVQEEADRRPDMKCVCNMLDSSSLPYRCPLPPPVVYLSSIATSDSSTNLAFSSSVPTASTSDYSNVVEDQDERTEAQPTWVRQT